MADEILYSGLGDLRLTETLSALVLLLLADRNALPNHSALAYAGDCFRRASRVLKVSHVGLYGYDLPASGTEGTNKANTALTDGSTQVTVGLYQKVYEQGDIARFTDPNGQLNADRFAEDAVVSGAMRLTNLIANVTDDFTSTVGTSGVDLNYQNVMDAAATLQIANAEPPYISLLHTRQLWDFKTDLAGTGGAIQFAQATQDQLKVRGGAYEGNWLGIDFFKSNQVPTANAGADRAGGMFAYGGVLWGDMSVEADDPINQFVLGDMPVTLPNGQIVRQGKILFERERTARGVLTAWLSSLYLGVAKGIDGNGVSIITDA